MNTCFGLIYKLDHIFHLENGRSQLEIKYVTEKSEAGSVDAYDHCTRKHLVASIMDTQYKAL